METVVLSIGGSLINPGKPDSDFLKSISALLKKSKFKFGIVTGGGKIARDYAEAVRRVGRGEFDADETAIISTKQNARLLIAALGDDAYPSVLKDFEDAKKATLTSRIVVMGGTIPGITTDTDSVLLAEKLGAVRIVNMSNVDAVYSEDPRVNPNAKRYSSLTFDEMVVLASKSDQRKAGTHFVFDLFACKLIARSGIETHLVNGKNLADVEAAISGKKHSGTVVK